MKHKFQIGDIVIKIAKSSGYEAFGLNSEVEIIQIYPIKGLYEAAGYGITQTIDEECYKLKLNMNSKLSKALK